MVDLTPEQKRAFGGNYIIPTPSSPQIEGMTPNEAQAAAKTQADTAEFMVMKAALLETTATRGWAYIQRFAETVLRDLEKAVIEEDDDTKANGLRHDAKGARKFKEELFRRIDLAKNQEPAQFLEVITE